MSYTGQAMRKTAALSALGLLWLSVCAHPQMQAETGGVVPIALYADEQLSLDADLLSPAVIFSLKRGDSAFVAAPVGKGELKQMQDWQIQIFDSDKRKVSFLQGRAAPASHEIAWFGLTDAGEPLPDGIYSARFVWLDALRQFHATALTSVMLMSPPLLRSLFVHGLKFFHTDEGLLIRIQDGLIFRPGQYEISRSMKPALAQLAAFLRKHPGYDIAVRGYSDSTGSLFFNVRLSRQRARTIYSYLIGRGVDFSRMSYDGFGPDHPIASNATAAGRALNRRVEVLLKGA